MKKQIGYEYCCHDTGKISNQSTGNSIAGVSYSHRAEIDGNNVKGCISGALHYRSDPADK
jgi:hypothetical protein